MDPCHEADLGSAEKALGRLRRKAPRGLSGALLRGIFRKRREPLLDLSQCAAEALAEYTRRELGAQTRPGIVVSIATAGDLLQWNPHGHILVTDGAFSDEGTLHPLATWDAEALMRLFRERLLARLVEKHAISQELATKVMAWRQPGLAVAVVGEVLFVWFVGSALCFDLPARLAARSRYREDEVSRLLGGSAGIAAGLALAGLVMADPSGLSRGVPPWVGVGAGGVFFLAGVLILAGGRGGLAGPLVVAIFLSLFAAISLALFPPGGLVVAYVAVQGWIAVYRQLHQWITRRDPLAGASDTRLLGVGCVVFLVLLLLVLAVAWLSSRGG